MPRENDNVKNDIIISILLSCKKLIKKESQKRIKQTKKELIK